MKNQVVVNCATPTKLYRYADRMKLERALSLGEFLLNPASAFKNADASRRDDELVRVRMRMPKDIKIVRVQTGQEVKPLGPIKFEMKSTTDYLILCFSKIWNTQLFEKFSGTDRCCLVIHDVPEFQERIHNFVAKILPDWSGCDIAVEYGQPHPLRLCFSKAPVYADENEWRFAWRPRVAIPKAVPTFVTIGSIADIAEIRSKNL